MRMRDPALMELAVEVLISAMEQMSTLRMDSHVDMLANLLGSLANDVASVCAGTQLGRRAKVTLMLCRRERRRG